jgi:Domain of unknown function DUF11
MRNGKVGGSVTWLLVGALAQACAEGPDELVDEADDDLEVTASSALTGNGPDLSVTVQGQNSATPGQVIPYNVLVLNRGTANAAALTVTLSVTNAASVTVAGASCTTSGNTRTCTFGSPSLMRGFAFRKAVQIVAPSTPGAMTIQASVSTAGELNPANNSFALSAPVNPLPPALTVAAPQNTDNLVCAGGVAPLTFANCEAAPSSYVPSAFTLHADQSVGMAGAATRVGVWEQPTPTSLRITNPTSTPGVSAVWDGTMYAPSCFRGSISYPGRATPWYGAFQLCLVP